MSKRKENLFENIEQEVLFLRKQNASLRGLNASLKKEVERYKRLDREGDEMNERNISYIEGMKSTISDKEKTIVGLQSQVLELNKVVSEKDARIEQLAGDISVAEANLEYYKSQPWYRKIFKLG